jgi:hypothetical protein
MACQVDRCNRWRSVQEEHLLLSAVSARKLLCRQHVEICTVREVHFAAPPQM